MVEFRFGYRICRDGRQAARLIVEIMRLLGIPEDWTAHSFDYEDYAAYGVRVNSNLLVEQKNVVDVLFIRQAQDKTGFIYDGKLYLLDA